MSLHTLALIVLILLVAKTSIALGIPGDKTKKVEWTTERILLVTAAVFFDVFVIWMIAAAL